MPTLKNGRHELFAQQVAKGKPLEEAYALAGYKPHASSASRLRTSAKVAARIEELQQRVAERTVTSATDIIEQLSEDRDFARFLGAPSAAVAATMGQAKVLGLGNVIPGTNINTGVIINITLETTDAGLL